MHNGAAPTASPPSALAFPSCTPGRRILDLWQRDAGKHTDIRLELVSMPDDSEAINDIVTHLGEDVDLIRPRHVQRLRRIRRPAHLQTDVGRHSPAARQRGRGLARTGRHALRTALPARCKPGDSHIMEFLAADGDLEP